MNDASGRCWCGYKIDGSDWIVQAAGDAHRANCAGPYTQYPAPPSTPWQRLMARFR